MVSGEEIDMKGRLQPRCQRGRERTGEGKARGRKGRKGGRKGGREDLYSRNIYYIVV